MSDAQLKKLKAEKERLESELDVVKNIVKVSEACSDLVKYIQNTPEPLDTAGNTNPFTKKVSNGGCILV